MDARDTARTEPTELEFVSTVRGAANKDEVADGEGRSDYVVSLVVGWRARGEDSRHLCGFHPVSLLQLFNTNELQSASAVDCLRAGVVDVSR